MYRIEAQRVTGERIERYCRDLHEAAVTFDALLFTSGVRKVLAYERAGGKDGIEWRLMRIGS